MTTPGPLPDGHPLYTLPNVFISPHISWAGGDQDQAFQHRLMKNLDAYLKGEELEALVDPARLLTGVDLTLKPSPEASDVCGGTTSSSGRLRLPGTAKPRRRGDRRTGSRQECPWCSHRTAW